MSVSENLVGLDCAGAALPLGATPADWLHFHANLGLTRDLFPVVCNAKAEISPRSKLDPANLCRVPCKYDSQEQVVGITGWTEKLSSASQVEIWMKEPDHGICLVTREVRGLDVDVTDPELADEIAKAIEQTLGLKLPTRCREGVSKRLLAVRVEGKFSKRTLKVANGEIVEFLANGQQFVAAGSRADGSRYYWNGGLPEIIPTITEDELNRLWTTLEERFGVAPSPSASGEKPEQWAEPVGYPEHQLADMLKSIVPEQGYDQWLKIGMALHHETYGEGFHLWDEWSAPGETYPGSEHLQSKWDGFGRQTAPGVTIRSVKKLAEDAGAIVGGPIASPDDFDVIEDTPEEIAEKAERKTRFKLVSGTEFMRRQSPGWLVKKLLPDANLVLIYGASGSGKSFVMIDVALALARGVPWFGRKVKQRPVVYVCAEGEGGFANRLKAYALRNGLDELPIEVLAASPNLLEPDDLKDLIATIKPLKDAVVILDTLARVTPGANENAGEDMGRAIDNCSKITRATGARVILVHHTGKDKTKGARGWSGMRAAADAELEVVRDEVTGKRWIETTKQKDTTDQGRIGFRLEDVFLDIDDEGEAVTSCVIVEDEAPETGRASNAKAEVKYGALEQLLLKTFAELRLGGEVKRSDLLIRAAEKDPGTGLPRDRKKNLNQALKALARSGKKQAFILGDGYVTEVEK